MIWEMVVEVASGLVPVVEEWLSELGSHGVVIEDGGDSLVFEPGGEFARARVKGYFEDPDRQELELKLLLLLASHQVAVSGIRIGWQALEDEDWQNGWKRFFQPLAVGERLAVLPSWCELPAELSSRLVIGIDPEMAFGSGTHETTRGCMEGLERVAAVAPLGRVLDLGTGSGILAIAALRLGATAVTATDCDPIAVATCLRNCRLNQVGDRVEVLLAATVPPGQFDTVVANILAPVLLELAPGVISALRPGGHLILSGVLSDQVGQVQAAFTELGVGGWWVVELGAWAILGGVHGAVR